MYIKKQIGKVGEDISCRYLKENNYLIHKRNFRCKQGEIDIIAYDNDLKQLVFIEVKTRSNTKYGRPCEAVNYFKKKHIISASKYYNLINNIQNISLRYDVIEIILNNGFYKLNHIKNAF